MLSIKQTNYLCADTTQPRHQRDCPRQGPLVSTVRLPSRPPFDAVRRHHSSQLARCAWTPVAAGAATECLQHGFVEVPLPTILSKLCHPVNCSTDSANPSAYLRRHSTLPSAEFVSFWIRSLVFLYFYSVELSPYPPLRLKSPLMIKC